MVVVTSVKVEDFVHVLDLATVTFVARCLNGLMIRHFARNSRIDGRWELWSLVSLGSMLNQADRNIVVQTLGYKTNGKIVDLHFVFTYRLSIAQGFFKRVELVLDEPVKVKVLQQKCCHKSEIVPLVANPGAVFACFETSVDSGF